MHAAGVWPHRENSHRRLPACAATAPRWRWPRCSPRSSAGTRKAASVSTSTMCRARLPRLRPHSACDERVPVVAHIRNAKIRAPRTIRPAASSAEDAPCEGGDATLRPRLVSVSYGRFEFIFRGYPAGRAHGGCPSRGAILVAGQRPMRACVRSLPLDSDAQRRQPHQRRSRHPSGRPGLIVRGAPYRSTGRALRAVPDAAMDVRPGKT